MQRSYPQPLSVILVITGVSKLRRLMTQANNIINMGKTSLKVLNRFPEGRRSVPRGAKIGSQRGEDRFPEGRSLLFPLIEVYDLLQVPKTTNQMLVLVSS